METIEYTVVESWTVMDSFTAHSHCLKKRRRKSAQIIIQIMQIRRTEYSERVYAGLTWRVAVAIAFAHRDYHWAYELPIVLILEIFELSMLSIAHSAASTHTDKNESIFSSTVLLSFLCGPRL